MILLLRMIADMLWSLKAVNIAVNFLLLFVILRYFFIGKAVIHKRAKRPLVILTILFFLLSTSFIRNIGVETAILYFKITFSFLIFFYGTIFHGNIYNKIRTLERFSFFFIVFNLVLSFLPSSYQYWGNIYTFNGLYFFKTDMALAIVIFLSLVLLSRSLDTKIKIVLAIISLYLVYLTNARIHILSIFLVCGINILGQNLFKNLKQKIIKYLPVGILIFIGVIGIYNSFSSGALQIQISGEGVYKSGNLQGRDKIWEAIIAGYNNGSSFNQLFGTNLIEDVRIVTQFSSLSHNAHNTYLFLLIAVGMVGLLLFLFFTWLLFNQIARSSKWYSKVVDSDNRYEIYVILNLALVHTSIFLISSLTNSSILFQQQTWFFLFFTGYLFNNNFIQFTRESYTKEMGKLSSSF